MSVLKEMMAESSGSEDLVISKDSVPLSLEESQAMEKSPTTEGYSRPPEDADTEFTEEQVVRHARAYQIEMFEASLKENIIVAMDTGSGKTQVAVMRIQAELEKPSDKIIWFLATTVALCEQQSRVLRSQIPAVQIKFLSSADNVETWSERRIWDDYLKNVSIVVSTHQVLLDAITHAFVSIDRLSLIVFDEAHNCIGNHPGSKIMERYQLNKSAGLPIPKILGLTASPVISSFGGIEKIESTLDAICRTPSLHREELMSAVKRPTMSCITYHRPDCLFPTDSMRGLAKVVQSWNIYEDPYIVHLMAHDTERSRVYLERALLKEDTYCIKQLRSLWRRSIEIQKDIGSPAADYFLLAAITQFLESVDTNDAWLETWTMEEKQKLAQVLRHVPLVQSHPIHEPMTTLSHKLLQLTKLLKSMDHDTLGIIFVQEVATVAVLKHILQGMDGIRDRFRIGAMVGTSNSSQRKRDIGELTRANSLLDLDDFRAGKLNLLIATSVLEEGIDVPACNLVVCFDKPSNLKSFIQRRGRARRKESKLILLLEEQSGERTDWPTLEEAMKRQYEDDMRQIQQLAGYEEAEVEKALEPLKVAKTGARLDFDQAKSHLEHFCRVITSRQYVDPRPYYITREVGKAADDRPRINATVVLPASLPSNLRRIKGVSSWSSEKSAYKDAALQAYKVLHEAGLVNDNLMPLIDEMLEDIKQRSPFMEVSQLWNPWYDVAQRWKQPAVLQQRPIFLKDEQGGIMCEASAILPDRFPKPPSSAVYWDSDHTWLVDFGDATTITERNRQADQSLALLDLAYGHRWVVEPEEHVFHVQTTPEILLRERVGEHAIEPSLFNPDALIRVQSCYQPEYRPFNANSAPFVAERLFVAKPPLESVKHVFEGQEELPVHTTWVACSKWPRRQDFLHAMRNQANPKVPEKRYYIAIPSHLCRQDGVERAHVHLGALIPSIMHLVEVYLVAEELCYTVLKSLNFSNVSLLVTAICSRAANEATDYERLEFLGDSILKLLATASVSVKYPYEPEGYLSARKDRIVSNSRLCRASVEAGLDRFIITKGFTGLKWRPLYTNKLLEQGDNAPGKRLLSTKTLADVVESLIGAAHEDGGMDRALKCVQLLLPEVDWCSLDTALEKLALERPLVRQLPPALKPLEDLLGYTFKNKALLQEAATHTSYSGSAGTESCMERLEFIGDALLDSIIVSALWAHDPESPLSNQDMHLLRTVTVNADLLGFLAMEWWVKQTTTTIAGDAEHTTLEQETRTPLWKFMRHSSRSIGAAQRAAEARYLAEREAIREAMVSGSEFPWALLAHLGTPKAFSDFFEAVLGAVWLDSGSLDTCRDLIERAGILPCLRRLLKDKVVVMHPKNRLGELAARRLVRVAYESKVHRGENGAKELRCKLLLNDEVFVEVGDGINPAEVQTRAADLAFKKLDAEVRREDQDMQDV
ncbi:hypothetical protein F4780DRAFT_669124 [Xylariomycetidae sp. FL0641]|nr:hypothetical protein F4780DRAFT_669124 [Xylariomycetidae sp. FL0641]